ncbi:MAG TPA: DUF2442 domain-containing protein [Candidatus Polarisedimenticolaceae bacterium]|nr:DUF2442 domain-containing protein [Candidatus Polarisedimenticolaceae bacterium]
MIPRVVAVEQIGPWRLRLRFDEASEGEIDMRAYVPFEGIFEPLKDPSFFAQVRLDATAGTIVWPNGAAPDPWVLHALVTGDPMVPEAEEAAEPRLNEGEVELREIGRVQDIVVSLCDGDDDRAHVHARMGPWQVALQVHSFVVLDGGLPPHHMGLLLDWTDFHRKEIQDLSLAHMRSIFRS